MRQESKHTSVITEEIQALKDSVYSGYCGMGDARILAALLAELEALKAQRDNYENLAIENHASVTRLMEERDRLKASGRQLYEALMTMTMLVEAGQYSDGKNEFLESAQFALFKYEEANKPT